MFTEGFEKISGIKSEIAGGVAWLPVPSAIGAAVGASHGAYSKKEQEDANKKTWSNAVPGIAGYRLMRRNLAKQEEKKHKKD